MKLGFLLDKRITLIGIVIILVLILVIFLDFKMFEDKNDLIEGVVIEFHGFFFDLLFFGLILSIYDYVTNRRTSIRRLTEELDDYRGWEEGAAEKRIRGIVKRLLFLKFTKLDLRRCYLPNSKSFGVDKMIEWKFRYAILRDSSFNEKDFSRSNFRFANLVNCQFDSCILSNCDFAHANLCDTNFDNCELQNVNLEFARINKGFLASMKKSSNKHINDTLGKYKESIYKVDAVKGEMYHLELRIV